MSASIVHAREGQPGRAEAADAPGQADRAAGARDQAEAHLGQRDLGVLGRHHPPREGRQLDARADARPVHVGGGAGGHPGHGTPDAALEADQVRRGRVGPGAELVEVPAGAERPPLGVQGHGADALVEGGEGEGLDELVAHRGVERVEAPGARQGDRELVPGPRHVHPRPGVGARAAPGAAPARRRTPGRPAGPSRRRTRPPGPRRARPGSGPAAAGRAWRRRPAAS